MKLTPFVFSILKNNFIYLSGLLPSGNCKGVCISGLTALLKIAFCTPPISWDVWVLSTSSNVKSSLASSHVWETNWTRNVSLVVIFEIISAFALNLIESIVLIATPPWLSFIYCTIPPGSTWTAPS